MPLVYCNLFGGAWALKLLLKKHAAMKKFDSFQAGRFVFSLITLKILRPWMLPGHSESSLKDHCYILDLSHFTKRQLIDPPCHTKANKGVQCLLEIFLHSYEAFICYCFPLSELFPWQFFEFWGLLHFLEIMYEVKYSFWKFLCSVALYYRHRWCKFCGRLYWFPFFGM